ncbi:MAG: NAD(P)/FAD-dependent oxidoreductase [Marmoricola sp.]|nr:NAD(P)/FAD-dependent oxidoreductase [Marmoricola sp.]
MAIKLNENPALGDFLVIDKGVEVGGTWRDNTYPGAACDVPSQLYSFSFSPNRDWSRSFSPQPEIHAYMKRVAEEAGVLDRFRFGVSVESAAWDEADNVWRISTTAGEISANVLVTGSGGLSEPKLPEIDGIDTFAGEIFHSARWNHDYDLTGKRVAIIGTGASSIQIVPEVAKKVAHLDVYQRTAPWVLPRNDRAYLGVEKLGFRFVPGFQKAYRTAIYWALESRVPMFTGQLPQMRIAATAMAKRNIAKGITDPELRKTVTPDFEIGCKRVLISNAYYPALARDNVDVVTDGITEITPTGLVTSDGTIREVDAIIVATGFYTTDQPIAAHVKGLDGRTLADAWSEHGMAAYKGTTISGFPNLFQIVGPNTGLSHSSMVFIIESQIAYAISALTTMKAKHIASVEPLRAAQEEWNADLQSRMQRTVWNSGGCASWYLDEHGKNTILWPRSTFKFRQLLSTFDIDSYVTTPSKEQVA